MIGLFRRPAVSLLCAVTLAMLTPGLRAQSNYATQYSFTTIAGSAGKSGSVDATGSSALFDGIQGVAVDSSGNLYVADSANSTVRKITTAGVVTTLAGLAGSPGTADGTGSSARFKGPSGIAVDGAGNVYVTDPFAQSIRKISPSGVVTTLAGGSTGSADGTGSAAQFNRPSGIAVDGTGNLYVADANNDTIRKVTSAGIVTTLAGNSGNYGSADGTGASARFSGPNGIAVDGSGNVYVADTFNSTIRKVTSTGVVTTLAGTHGATGSADGTGGAALFNFPYSIAIDASGNLFVSDSDNDTIRKATSSGVVTTLAGSAATAGYADGIGSGALFSSPYGITVGGNGSIYIGDMGNDVIRMGVVAPATAPSVLAQPSSESVGLGSIANFSVKAAGVPLPEIQWQFNGANIAGATQSTLAINNAQLANAGSYTVVISNGSGAVTSQPAILSVVAPITYAANYYAGLGAAQNGPAGVAVDPAGNVYVTLGDAIERVSPSGVPTVFAGNITVSGSADGTGGSASFNKPQGIAADSQGNLYIADTGNNSIRKVTPLGAVTTLAGLIEGSADGKGVSAQFNQPTAVAVDSVGNVFVAEAGNDDLRQISPDGTTSTLLSVSSLTFANQPNETDVNYTIIGVQVDKTGIPYVALEIIPPQFPAVSRIGATLEVRAKGAFSVLYQGSQYFGSLVDDSQGNVFLFTGDYQNSQNSTYSTVGGVTSGTLLPVAVSSVVDGPFFITGQQAVILVTPVGSAPNISAEPAGATIAFGAQSTLSVTASGTPSPAYQWQVDGTNIPGATSSTYTTSQPGTYSVIVTNSAGTVTSYPAVITASDRLANISSRAYVGTGANVEIAGFVVAAPIGTSEQVLIRAAGPSLSQFGVGGVLAQPVLTLFDSKGNQLATNAGWNTAANATAIAAAFTATGAFAFPLDSADSAIATSLPAGSYTAQIAGLNGGTGVALAEVYEASASDPELINISTRAYVSAGSSVEIGGFVIKGAQPAKVLVRAVGPALAQFGVSGVLATPTLSVVDSGGNVVATNTGWSTNSTASTIASEMVAVGAFPFPSGSADSALLVTLAPGAYTAIVSGAGNSSGVALVEVYQAP